MTDNKHPGGRPSKYRPEFPEQAKKICLLGATDNDLANFFEVHVDTIKAWKKDYPEFSAALKAGKDQADAQVAQSLYRRALGYSHEAVKIFADVKTGAEQIVPYIEHYPPDTTACIFWLKNRQPKLWRAAPEAKGDEDAPQAVRVEVVVKDASRTDDTPGA